MTRHDVLLGREAHFYFLSVGGLHFPFKPHEIHCSLDFQIAETLDRSQ